MKTLNKFTFGVAPTNRTYARAASLTFLAFLTSVFCGAWHSISQSPPSQRTGQPTTTRDSHAAGDLLVTISVAKAQYKVGDTIQLQVLLTNLSSQAIYMPIPFDWGNSASLEAWAFDSDTRREMESRVIADANTPPPRGRDDFAKLLPNHILGVRDTFPLKELGIDRAGRFDVRVEYHSPVPRGFSFNLPIRSSEQGGVESNTIMIQVSR